ncbi:uncharacterized protein H6S33_006318 [Morchella sextelata]|uniref:uncharacterized protein n=1 Tax=Morchella sextelata TaxID=1174677 RepID=UPI001D0508D7|nr:uncharacterized protein H6S33_006318 [Morchella sextelata]KAH0604650.1 hypothetical protein H6S33_006318 [Morchella sextelata]
MDVFLEFEFIYDDTWVILVKSGGRDMWGSSDVVKFKSNGSAVGLVSMRGAVRSTSRIVFGPNSEGVFDYLRMALDMGVTIRLQSGYHKCSLHVASDYSTRLSRKPISAPTVLLASTKASPNYHISYQSLASTKAAPAYISSQHVTRATNKAANTRTTSGGGTGVVHTQVTQSRSLSIGVTGYLSQLLIPCPIYLSSGWISSSNVVQHRFPFSQGVLEGAVSNGEVDLVAGIILFYHLWPRVKWGAKSVEYLLRGLWLAGARVQVEGAGCGLQGWRTAVSACRDRGKYGCLHVVYLL